MTLLLLLNPKCYVDPYIIERAEKTRVDAELRRKKKEITEVEEAEILAIPKKGIPKTPQKSEFQPELVKKFSGFTGISLKILDLEKQLAAADREAEAYQALADLLQKLESDRIELAKQILLMRDEEEIIALLLLLN